MPRPAQTGDPAAAAWRLMFDFLMKSAPARERSISRRGLTPNDARALFTLDASAGMPIGTLATRWGCDPSNATWIVDRLERADLAERRPSQEDRRVKLVTLTAAGVKTRRELLAEYHRPPPEFSRLTRAELTTLRGILTRLSQRGDG
jgi:DNA-binding MarR family transcriptional regulator